MSRSESPRASRLAWSALNIRALCARFCGDDKNAEKASLTANTTTSIADRATACPASSPSVRSFWGPNTSSAMSICAGVNPTRCACSRGNRKRFASKENMLRSAWRRVNVLLSDLVVGRAQAAECMTSTILPRSAAGACALRMPSIFARTAADWPSGRSVETSMPAARRASSVRRLGGVRGASRRTRAIARSTASRSATVGAPTRSRSQ
mmetsp:Transcript_5989/g.25049  ORF Transcript_5989/g.25049 Transcript_5989/m.25049 type:complete len:209 (-) Transcript_5989:1201-1827(-)